MTDIEIDYHKLQEIKGVLLIKLTGYIDTYDSDYVYQSLKNPMESYKILIFDLEKLNYVSSTGIGIFVLMLKELKNCGGDLILVNLQPKVLEVFQLLGFSQFFNIQKSVQDGINSVISLYDNKTIFPIVVQCPTCTKKLKATRQGRFKCPTCKSIITIDETGSIYLG